MLQLCAGEISEGVRMPVSHKRANLSCEMADVKCIRQLIASSNWTKDGALNSAGDIEQKESKDRSYCNRWVKVVLGCQSGFLGKGSVRLNVRDIFTPRYRRPDQF